MLLDLSLAEVGQPAAAESLWELAIYYAQHVKVLRGLARQLTWRPGRVRQAGPIPQGWPYAITGLLPGINEVEEGARLPAPAPETWVAHPLDLDIGEVADGYHLIARSICLSAEHLLFEFAFSPELTGEAEVWLNMSYTADIPVSQDYIGAGNDVQYARPPLKARYAWFDFFRPDYDGWSMSTGVAAGSPTATTSGTG